jgi:S1-C subfamily serine protease
MEDLTKHQLILINLLITFVTSIATGIITFTLLSEAPVEVTQQINRVVEKTIERVVPAEPGKPEKVVTTVVVNEEDRVLDAISKNEKSVVRLKTLGADGTEIISGLGLVISADGVVVADLRSYSSTAAYSISFHDGKVYPTGKVFIDNENGLVFIKTQVPISEPKYAFYPVSLGNSDGLKIGQTIVAISGKDSNAVSIGRVRQISLADDKKSVTEILSDIIVSRSFPGSPIVNLSGEAIGLEKQAAEGGQTYSYMPINTIKISLPKALEELSK